MDNELFEISALKTFFLLKFISLYVINLAKSIFDYVKLWLFPKIIISHFYFP